MLELAADPRMLGQGFGKGMHHPALPVRLQAGARSVSQSPTPVAFGPLPVIVHNLSAQSLVPVRPHKSTAEKSLDVWQKRYNSHIVNYSAGDTLVATFAAGESRIIVTNG